jgi:hypothetical protein
MSLFKYIDRIQAIHSIIEKQGTGLSSEFAARVGISRSLLMDHIKELRDTFGAPISFCRKRKTFFYTKPFTFQVKIFCECDKLRGGSSFFLQNLEIQNQLIQLNYGYEFV